MNGGYLGPLRRFLEHCAASGSLPQLSPDHIRLALKGMPSQITRPYRILGEEEWPSLLDATRQPRDHALIALALATGLRAVELASLNVGFLEREYYAGREEWWLVLPDRATKGQVGGRTLPLDRGIVRELLGYLAGRRRGPLFLSGGERMTPKTVGCIVGRAASRWKAAREGETRSISTHSLRHSAACALLLGNPAVGRPPASLEHVRGWLGHRSIKTTAGYLAHIQGREHRRPFVVAPRDVVDWRAPQPPPQPFAIGERVVWLPWNAVEPVEAEVVGMTARGRVAVRVGGRRRAVLRESVRKVGAR